MHIISSRSDTIESHLPITHHPSPITHPPALQIWVPETIIVDKIVESRYFQNVLDFTTHQGGMRWIRERAEALLQLRCIEINGDWEAFFSFVHKKINRKQRSSRRAQRLLRDAPGPLPTRGVS